MRNSLHKFFAVNIILMGLSGHTALAASLQVSPTTVNFDASQKAQSVWFTNSGTETIRGQVRLYNWQQINGQEKLSQASSMIVTPAIVSVQPGKKQLIRLVLPKTPDKETGRIEQAYRLMVNELPTTTAHANGLQFLLSYSVPVFVNQKEDTAAQTLLNGVHISLAAQNGSAVLIVDNTQTKHIKLSQVTFTPENGKPVSITPGLLGYTLAKQKMEWPIKLPANQIKHGGMLNATVNNDAKPQMLSVRGS